MSQSGDRASQSVNPTTVARLKLEEIDRRAHHQGTFTYLYLLTLQHNNRFTEWSLRLSLTQHGETHHTPRRTQRLLLGWMEMD